MGFFAKKTFTGYREVPGGYSDPEAEYYIAVSYTHLTLPTT